MSAEPRHLVIHEFVVPGAVPNWSNQRLHYMRLYAERTAWHTHVREALARGRSEGDSQLRGAVQGERRRVTLTMYRVRLLDPDALPGSVKPLLDSLKHHHWRRLFGRHMVQVDGPGVIYDDDERHLELTVRQLRVPHYREQRTVITVETAA